MTGMKAYYLSRAVISAGFGLLFGLSGSPWWTAVLVGAAAFAWFLAAPHIGRYSVHPEFGVTALRRDERSQGINDKATRNAFVISMLAVGGMIAYYAAFPAIAVPVAALRWILILGAVVYYSSDFWLRRAQA